MDTSAPDFLSAGSAALHLLPGSRAHREAEVHSHCGLLEFRHVGVWVHHRISSFLTNMAACSLVGTDFKNSCVWHWCVKMQIDCLCMIFCLFCPYWTMFLLKTTGKSLILNLYFIYVVFFFPNTHNNDRSRF